MNISSDPFQLCMCICPYLAHTSLYADVQLQTFVFPVTLIKYASYSRREASQEARESQLSSTHDSPLSVQCTPLGALHLCCQIRASKMTSRTCNLNSAVQICGKQKHIFPIEFTCISNCMYCR